MPWAVTWTSWSGTVGTAYVDTEAEANVLTVCLGASGIGQIAKWNPAGQCVWVNGVRSEEHRPKHAKSDCIHPPDEPCFASKKLARLWETWREDRM